MLLTPIAAPRAPFASTPSTPAAAGGMGLVAPSRPLVSDSAIEPRRIQTEIRTTTGAQRPGRQGDALLGQAVKEVLAADDTARIAVDPTSNAATFVSGEFGVVLKPGIGGGGPDQLARTFLVQHGSLFGLTDQAAQLKLVDVESDAQGYRHFRYQQQQNGLPVFGQQLIVHATGDNVTSVGGRVTPNIQAATPKLAAGAATAQALATTRRALQTDGLESAQLTPLGDGVLGWFTTTDGTPRLAYEVVVGQGVDQRWQMYVDAESGDLLDRWSLVHSALNRETVNAQTGKVRKEGDAATGDAPLDAAHDTAKDVYDFFLSKYGRDSIDGKGMKLKSNVHYGKNYNNAFWNGSSMTYGDGDGVRFIPFSLGSDVVGHEMTHGVTERTANLRYSRQSGALNESWSDVFGNLIEKWAEARQGKPESDPNWLIGEAIFTPNQAGDGLRSMKAPGTGYVGDKQPAHMKDYNNTPSDNGGVHINSGIPNKAAYDIAQTIGKDMLADIWYRALTTYMTPSTQFVDAANVTVQSAVDLYGAGSAEAAAVAAAWTNVGLAPATKPATTA